MDSRVRDLILAALEKTERGGLTWKAFDDETFRVPIATGFLHIRRGSTRLEDPEGEVTPVAVYSIQVSDAQGRVVAEEDVLPGVDGDGAYNFSLSERLFRAARKSALGTDRVIDDMLQALRGGSRA
jgi:hypothetical protein